MTGLRVAGAVAVLYVAGALFDAVCTLSHGEERARFHLLEGGARGP